MMRSSRTSLEVCGWLDNMMYIIIDHEAEEVIHLVESVRLLVYLRTLFGQLQPKILQKTKSVHTEKRLWGVNLVGLSTLLHSSGQ